MAKKYEQSRKDREDERRGMERRLEKGIKKGESRSWITGNDPMVGRDSNAGLPSEVVMEKYPRNKMGKEGYLNDTMNQIDENQRDSERFIRNNMSDQH